MDDFTKKCLENFREMAAQAACVYCSYGVPVSGNGTHTITGQIGATPVFHWCEGRTIRNLPLVP